MTRGKPSQRPSRADRDLARLLSRLETAAHVIGKAGEGPALRLWVLDAAGRQPKSTVDIKLFKLALARDFLVRTPEGCWRRTDAGTAWLARLGAGADPFRRQHLELRQQAIEVSGSRRAALVNVAESPLSWLFSRKDKNGASLISADQFAAGERLRKDFTYAQMQPGITSSWSPVSHRTKRRTGERGGTAEMLDSAIAARQRVLRALAEVGPELADILLDVCCFLKGLREVESANNWPQRSAKQILQLALTRLARHYGISPPPESHLKRRLRSWGAEAYRPTIDGN